MSTKWCVLGLAAALILGLAGCTDDNAALGEGLGAGDEDGGTGGGGASGAFGSGGATVDPDDDMLCRLQSGESGPCCELADGSLGVCVRDVCTNGKEAEPCGDAGTGGGAGGEAAGGEGGFDPGTGGRGSGGRPGTGGAGGSVDVGGRPGTGGVGGDPATGGMGGDPGAGGMGGDPGAGGMGGGPATGGMGGDPATGGMGGDPGAGGMGGDPGAGGMGGDPGAGGMGGEPGAGGMGGDPGAGGMGGDPGAGGMGGDPATGGMGGDPGAGGMGGDPGAGGMGGMAADDLCDGVDEDTDGLVDEDFEATATACGVGACAAMGQTACVDGRIVDRCRPLRPAEADATCDATDDDCDGVLDEDFGGGEVACGEGACAATGRSLCVDGEATDTCRVGEAADADDTCDAVDDDCDGRVDEDVESEAIDCGVGACAAEGERVCVNGAVQDRCVPGQPRPGDPSCDGEDQDCDGTADEDFVGGSTACGLGACAAEGERACADGAVTNTCTPGAPGEGDATCDGIDDDCDGATDEDYTPRDTTCGEGVCAAEGRTACREGAEVDLCAPGEPFSERDTVCDGVDEDCSGEADEDFEPQDVACGVGACAAEGVTVCADGEVFRECEPGDPAEDDAVCDGADADCDGLVDEDYTPEVVDCPAGACAREAQTICIDGEIEDACRRGDEGEDADAICDGFDEDCDGRVDEDYRGLDIECGEGLCRAIGETDCVNGREVDRCEPGEPGEEGADCDGEDQDCDGTADEDFVSRPTTCGEGVCVSDGRTVCIDGVEEDECTPGEGAERDATCDGLDDDCDGDIDEDFEGEPVRCGTGVCEAEGRTVCVEGELVERCAADDPVDDDTNCDGIDGDCDGFADEGFVGRRTTCGDGACTAEGEIICVDGERQNTCRDGEPAETDPTCDGVDDDCDGATDEDYAPEPTTCGEGLCAREGVLRCVGGEAQDNCRPGQPPVDADRLCDGVDEDCDGGIDEDFEGAPIRCGQGACIAEGELICVDGAVAQECTPEAPAEDDATCDRADDDCDGAFDEDFEPVDITCGRGICTREGTAICRFGRTIDFCQPGIPRFERCDNDLDDDCDGRVDEDRCAGDD